MFKLEVILKIADVICKVTFFAVLAMFLGSASAYFFFPKSVKKR